METGTAKPPVKGLSLGKMLAIMAAAMTITMITTLWLIKLWLFPGPFRPVTLTPAEEQKLAGKVARIESLENHGGAVSGKATGQAEATVAVPTPYSEEGASREIVFSEKELNALIGRNPDLAGKVAISLADNLVSATLLIPMQADAPLFAGQTMRIKTGFTMAYKDGHPVVALRGVSVMGVPMPNAWLGALKNIDLVKRYSSGGGFWQTFASGIEAVEIRDGQARIVLKP
ncbi:MAG: arginine N-succinyltransferase [Desulfobulbaceae bacterium]|jgi:hypothetical protein|nr:arginine N-succinyltransferase [Desulfobulbaceae bacterium]